MRIGSLVPMVLGQCGVMRKPGFGQLIYLFIYLF